MFCHKCGNQVSDDAVFCDKCGVSFVDKTIPKHTVLKLVLCLIGVCSIVIFLWSIVPFFSFFYPELELAAKDYKNRQVTYLATKGFLGNAVDIGFVFPNNENFKFNFEEKSLKITSQKKLGWCPAQTEWHLRVEKKGESMISICGVMLSEKNEKTKGLLEEWNRTLEDGSISEFESVYKKFLKKLQPCKILSTGFLAQCDSVFKPDAASFYESIIKESIFPVQHDFSKYLYIQNKYRDREWAYGTWNEIGFATSFPHSKRFSVKEFRHKKNDLIGVEVTIKMKIAGCPIGSQVILSHKKSDSGEWKCRIKSDDLASCSRLFEDVGNFNMCQWTYESSSSNPKNTWTVVE